MIQGVAIQEGRLTANLHGARRLEPLGADKIVFKFAGRPVEAAPGETIAVALLGAGFRVFRTMPGSGEARGGYCFAGRCSDCMMVVDGIPNTRACVTQARNGMDVSAQSGVGALPQDNC